MTLDTLLPYLKFQFSRASGPGGQHVNKTETRVQASIDLEQCPLFSETQKALLLEKLAPHITGTTLSSYDQSSRSQSTNKEEAAKKLLEWITKALKPVKKRKPTRIPPEADAKRREEKSRNKTTKSFRQKPNLNDD